MAERIYASLTTGNTYYAKPAPISSDPTWAEDVETLSEDDTVSGWFYSDSISNPEDVYVIFKQAGGSPADTDTLIGPVEMQAAVNTEVLDVIATDTLIDGKTLREAVRYVAAVLAGKLSGAGTGTETVVGLDGSTDRVTFTVDTSGNRTGVSYDP